jgi:hypothetical protein
MLIDQHCKIFLDGSGKLIRSDDRVVKVSEDALDLDLFNLMEIHVIGVNSTLKKSPVTLINAEDRFHFDEPVVTYVIRIDLKR